MSPRHTVARALHRGRLRWTLAFALGLWLGTASVFAQPTGGAPGAGGAAGGAAASAAGGGVDNTPNNPQRFMFRGTQEEIEGIRRILSEHDRLPRQVLIQMYLLDVNTSRADNSGVTLQTFFGAERPLAGLPLGAYEGAMNAANSNQTLRFGSLSTERFQLFMQFLKNMTDTRILSRPSAMVLDGGTATLNLGGQFSFLSRVETTTTAGGQVVRTPITATINTGQNLTLVPRILPNDIVLLNLDFDDTAIVRTNNFGAGDTAVSLPETSRRAIRTPLFLRDNSAVVIGGLKSQRRERNSSKIPLLGSLPFIGKNFGQNTKTYLSNELVLVLKASIFSQDDL